MIFNGPFHGSAALQSAFLTCLTPRRAEGGNSGRNSATDQRQIQATSQEGPVVGGDGQINTGLNAALSGNFWGDVSIADPQVVDAAFQFGESVLNQVGGVLAGARDTVSSTVASNTAALKTYSDALAANTTTGAAANANKTILYLGAAALAVVALIFWKR